MAIPLLIGGATTSKAHTAAKIAPARQQPVVYVTDASRSVGVCQSLMSDERRAGFLADIAEDYERTRERVAKGRRNVPLRPYEEAVRRAFAWPWESYEPPAPTFLGIRAFDDFPAGRTGPLHRLDAVLPHLGARRTQYPAILDDPVVGKAAGDLFRDAQDALEDIVASELFRARGVIGFWPANRIGADDLAAWTDDSRSRELARLRHLRQQQAARDVNLSLADFIAPPPIADYLGGFVVSVARRDGSAVGADDGPSDDYRDIMHKALADRLVEAFAEALHERVRKIDWGFAADERLDNAALIAERYRGIRPAPGYPACPDHSEKATFVRDAGRDPPHRRPAHRKLRHVASLHGRRLVLLPPRIPLLRRRQNRRRPTGRLRPAQGRVHGRNRPLALVLAPGLNGGVRQILGEWSPTSHAACLWRCSQ